MISFSLGLFAFLQLAAGMNLDAAAVRAAEALAEDKHTSFGNVTILGGMQRTNLTFTDGFAIDVFSAKPRVLSIMQSPKPSAPGEFVTPMDPSTMPLGSGFWTAVNNFSWVMKFNENGVDDLVARIEAPYDPVALSAVGFGGDTFLAKFDRDRAGWVVDTSKSSVGRAQNRTRIMGLSSLDGEFLLVGRKINGSDAHSTFIQVGSEAKDADFNVAGPPAGSSGEPNPSNAPLQIGTWIDGFQLAIRSSKALRINMNFINTSDAKIQSGFKAVSPYGYIVNSSDPTAKIEVAARLPFVKSQLAAQSARPSELQVAHLDVTSGEFRIVTSNANSTKTATNLKASSRTVEAPMGTSVDGKWILVAPDASNSTLAASNSTSQSTTLTSESATITSSATANDTSRPTSTSVPEQRRERAEERPIKPQSRSRMRRVKFLKSQAL